MALPGAIVIGGIAAAALPYLAPATSEGFQHIILAGTLHIPVGNATLLFSWPTFCIVTLASWMLLSAAE